MIFEVLRGAPERLERLLEPSWELWGPLGALKALLEPSWSPLGTSWTLLERYWSALAPLLGASWARYSAKRAPR